MTDWHETSVLGPEVPSEGRPELLQIGLVVFTGGSEIE